MKDKEKNQLAETDKIFSEEIELNEIDNVLSNCKEDSGDEVKLAVEKFFADSNASMMGGWT